MSTEEKNKETVKPSVPVAVPFQFNHKACQEHIDKIMEGLQKYAEVPGHNPYKWTNDNIVPLLTKMQAEDKTLHTKELQEAILKLPLNPVPKYFDVPKAGAGGVDVPKQSAPSVKTVAAESVK